MGEDDFDIETLNEELEDPDDFIEENNDTPLRSRDFSNLLVAPSDWTIETLHSQIGKQIDLDPAFQRRNVWNAQSKSRFIESLFLGIPIPQILLSTKPNQKNSYLVLDGKQRLLTIKEFIDGKFPSGRTFKLKKLRVLSELEGQSWSEIKKDDDWAYRLLNATQRTAVIRGWDDERVLYEIFFRLNSGSVRLSPMELRMSLHPGDFLKYIISWTEEPRNLHTLLGKKSSDPRMGDVELATRFLAFNCSGSVYKGDLKDFLDTACIEFNEKFSDESTQSQIKAALATLEEAIESGINIFGPKHFCRKYIGGAYENRFNRAIFDVLVGSLAHPDIRQFGKEHPQTFQDAFIRVSGSNEFIRSVETTTKSVLSTRTRFSQWYSELESITGVKLYIPDIQNEIPD